jgi:hypothetical protein
MEADEGRAGEGGRGRPTKGEKRPTKGEREADEGRERGRRLSKSRNVEGSTFNCHSRYSLEHLRKPGKGGRGWPREGGQK